jgi:hypothetical protein
VRATVTRVRYEDAVDAADRVEIDLVNPDLRYLARHIRGLGFQPIPTGLRMGPTVSLVPEGMTDIGNRLTLQLGYAGEQLSEVFVGEITGVEATFPSDGGPMVRIVAHDFLQRMAQGKAARGFGPIPDVLIAAILSAENLLVPLIDPAVAAASTALAVVNVIFGGSGRKQRGQSDLDFLREIAAQWDADFWVEGDVLYLARFLKEYEPRLTLNWGTSLVSFAPRVTTVGQVAGVAARFTLREIPIDFVVTAAWDFDREALAIRVVPGAAATVSVSGSTLGAGVLTLIDKPIGSPVDVTNSALLLAHKLRSTINNRLTGTATAVGDARIRAGAVVRLDGMGPDFSNVYRVTSAVHVIDAGGYVTEFDVHKEIIP